MRGAERALLRSLSQAPPRVNPPAAPAQIFCIIGLVKVELAFGIVGIIAVLPGTPGAE